MRVELDVFSGRRNPQWVLSTEQAEEFLKILSILPRKPTARKIWEGVGYRGFRVTVEAEMKGFSELTVYHDLVVASWDGQTQTWEDENCILEHWLIDISANHVPEALLARLKYTQQQAEN